MVKVLAVIETFAVKAVAKDYFIQIYKCK